MRARKPGKRGFVWFAIGAAVASLRDPKVLRYIQDVHAAGKEKAQARLEDLRKEREKRAAGR